ncbi:MAG TPA: hypothetical protein VM943_02070, partial [Pyrinomonadaceae bacterium]|nr:hypothetical protein [Pyrinomonadaceae bacterium]
MRPRVKIFYESLSRAALLLVCFGAIGVTVAAMTLAEYRERLREAAGALNSLAVIDEDEGEKERAAGQAQTFADVRRSLPPSERVEWRGETVTADNAWLHAALDRLEQLPITHPARADELTRLAERLNALGDRGAEIQTLSDSTTRDKEAEKGRLAAILRRPEYRQQDAAGGALRRLLDQF